MKVRKLTPSVLKRIIAEEKQRINRNSKQRKVRSNSGQSKKSLIESKIDEVTKLALQEAKLIKAIRKLRSKRKAIKSSVSKLSK